MIEAALQNVNRDSKRRWALRRVDRAPIDVSGRRSAKLLPDATLSEYDGEPNGLYLTAADRLNYKLLAFIGGR